MLQLPYEPFDDEHFDRNFRHTEFTDWRDGVLTDRVLPDLQRIGLSPTSLGWVKTGGRPRIMPRSIFELGLAIRFGVGDLVIDGYRHYTSEPLRLLHAYASDASPDAVVLGELPRAQGLLVSSLSNHDDPDIGYLDHEDSAPNYWYDGLSVLLARCTRGGAERSVSVAPIGFGTTLETTTQELWPRVSVELRRQLVRLGAFVPGTIAGKQGPVSMSRAALQLLGVSGGFTVGAVGALRAGGVLRFGPVSAAIGETAPGMLPIGTVASGINEPDRFVLLDLDDPHPENPGLFVTTGAAPAEEIGRVSELFAAVASLAR